MILLRSIGAAVFLAAVLAAATPASAGSAKSGSTEGTFVGIEQGDYAHFLIKDKKDRDDSFIILRPHKSVQSYFDNPVKLKGQNVRVFLEGADHSRSRRFDENRRESGVKAAWAPDSCVCYLRRRISRKERPSG